MLRSRSLFETCALFLTLSGLIVAAFGQSLPLANFLPGALPSTAETTISKRVDEVNLAFTVTDQKGRLVSNLNSDEFTILDNHIQPEGVNFFQQQTDLPLRIAVLVDASDSILYRLNYEKTVATMFLKRILRPGKDRAFVVSFNDQIRLVEDDTDNSKELSGAVKRIHAGGNTALYDAIVFGANKLRSSPPQTRRVMIVISDGEDTKSRFQLYDAERAAIQAEVTLFSMSTNESSSGVNSDGDTVLNRLTEASGGVVLQAHDEYRMSRAFRKVESILRCQYALAYRPARFAPDGSFRLVQLFTLRKGLKIQCRRGYYARQEVSTVPDR